MFTRLRAREVNSHDKIPVWPIMMDMTMVLDGEMQFSALATKYNLSQDEQLEAQEYLGAIGAMVQSEAGVRVGLGWPQVSATRDARVSVDAVLRYALLRAEQGTITLQGFRTMLGLV
jgi:hypothetical protein